MHGEDEYLPDLGRCLPRDVEMHIDLGHSYEPECRRSSRWSCSSNTSLLI